MQRQNQKFTQTETVESSMNPCAYIQFCLTLEHLLPATNEFLWAISSGNLFCRLFLCHKQLFSSFLSNCLLRQNIRPIICKNFVFKNSVPIWSNRHRSSLLNVIIKQQTNYCPEFPRINCQNVSRFNCLACRKRGCCLYKGTKARDGYLTLCQCWIKTFMTIRQLSWVFYIWVERKRVFQFIFILYYKYQYLRY